MVDADLVYDICNNVFEEFKDRLNNLSDDLSNSIIREMKEKGVAPYFSNKDQKSFRCSKAKLLLDERLISMINNYLGLTFLCSTTKKQLEDKMEVDSDTGENK